MRLIVIIESGYKMAADERVASAIVFRADDDLVGSGELPQLRDMSFKPRPACLKR